MKSSLFPAALVVVFLAACAATFSGGELTNIVSEDASPLAEGPRPLALQLQVWNRNEQGPSVYQTLLVPDLEALLRHRGWQPTVIQKVPPSGDAMVLKYETESTGKISGFCMVSLHLISLTLIPVRNRTDLLLVAEYYHDGRLQAQRRFEDHYTTWFHPLMLLYSDGHDMPVTIALTTMRNMALHFLVALSENQPDAAQPR
ncbi:MAG: hypothetical protein K1X75_14255 [Leptospirales bacterium]|nr:hypothetical protein [Leptospirales bacterium]